MRADSSTSQLTIKAATQPKLSAAQRKFNSLLKKIDTQRQTLQAWEAAFPKHQQRWHEDLSPLHALLSERKHALLSTLDSAGDRIKLAKADRQTLQMVVCELVTSLMDDTNHEQMKALYDKHSNGSFDEDERLDNLVLKGALEQAFGIELDDDFDLNSPEALASKLQDQLDKEERAQADARQKSAGGRETKAQEQARQASQSLREVYRKLASALHPDRESDEAERQRKTVLMQRANKAYAERNLLELLELQLEAEHLDPAALQTMSEERLKHYNHVLKEQHEELTIELNDIAMDFARQFELDPFARVTLANSSKHIDRALGELQQEISDLDFLLVEIASPKGLKHWLKAERIAMQQDGFSPFDEFDLYNEPGFPDGFDFPHGSKPFKG